MTQPTLFPGFDVPAEPRPRRRRATAEELEQLRRENAALRAVVEGEPPPSHEDLEASLRVVRCRGCSRVVELVNGLCRGCRADEERER